MRGDGIVEISADKVQRIYKCLGDELSKDVFTNRMMYSLTQDYKWIYENVKTTQEGRLLIRTLEEHKQKGENFVIFGTGQYGKSLYKIFPDYPWKCFIDNFPKSAEYDGLPILNATEFLQNYEGECICIFTKVFCKEIYDQLCNLQIPKDKIVSIYEIALSLQNREYFDLECMKKGDNKEIFVDGGCYDGSTSVHFWEWCHGNGEVYAFEPDKKNYMKCKQKFESHAIPYNLFNNGLWNENSILKFNETANMSSAILEEGNSLIEVVSLDSVMKDIVPTFIKMDIEGTELNALRGAKNIIESRKPKLAICVYHKDEDIIEVPNLILQLNEEYTLYLRHYSLVNYETVLYAI